MKLSTADCKRFLAQIMPAKVDAMMVKDTPEYLLGCQKAVAAAGHASKWKRIGKYGIGSNTDTDGADNASGDFYGGSDYAESAQDCYQLGFDPKGGTVREFRLSHEEDDIAVALLELNGDLFFLADLSD